MFVMGKTKQNKNLWRNMHRKVGAFSSILWCLLVPLLLFNYPSTACRLGHHRVWILSLTFLQMAKEPLISNNKKLLSSLVHSTSRPTFWFLHLMNKLDPVILYAPMNSSYMVQEAMSTAVVAWHFWMYVLMGHSPDISRASDTWGYPHSLSAVHW